MRPIWARAQAAGSAVTIPAPPGDNWMEDVAIEQLKEGDILALAPTSPCDNGNFGDLLATSAMARGCPGAGDRRRGARREGPDGDGLSCLVEGGPGARDGEGDIGSVNVLVVCAGAAIDAGDTIVADDDVVCVVRRAEAAEVRAAAEKRMAAEEAKRERLAAGELVNGAEKVGHWGAAKSSQCGRKR
jgi:4-hydroxy-4-methyl-2-oxoglutarate aldolase